MFMLYYVTGIILTVLDFVENQEKIVKMGYHMRNLGIINSIIMIETVVLLNPVACLLEIIITLIKKTLR